MMTVMNNVYLYSLKHSVGVFGEILYMHTWFLVSVVRWRYCIQPVAQILAELKNYRSCSRFLIERIDIVMTEIQDGIHTSIG